MSRDFDRDRHSRSVLFPGIGAAGQERIGRTLDKQCDSTAF